MRTATAPPTTRWFALIAVGMVAAGVWAWTVHGASEARHEADDLISTVESTEARLNSELEDVADLTDEQFLQRSGEMSSDFTVAAHETGSLEAPDTSVSGARAAYVDHLEAWSELLAAAADGDETAGARRSVQSTWAIAHSEFEALDLTDEQDARIAAIFTATDGTPDPSSTLVPGFRQ
ncbi:hypothetical protein [Cellulomonas sp. PhB143]|uniref:hypothetical protein n=1 Tax=Cellulomonas sp. PhB143 TaxID=2485186 RepID=UPI000F45F126|nr:hypothetical protein [Cellulomonas sp. PhB143]ROS74347.1 hypothetical protein EDF32_2088 [Cellulomonas sp. PhB143]